MNAVLRVVELQLAHITLQRVSPRAAPVVSVALVLTTCFVPLAAPHELA